MRSFDLRQQQFLKLPCQNYFWQFAREAASSPQCKIEREYEFLSKLTLQLLPSYLLKENKNKVFLSLESVGQRTNAHSVVSLSITFATDAMWIVWYQGIDNAFRMHITMEPHLAWC